eukprot:363400-Chlamydomonas_euryale.AAC.13
MGGKGGVGGIGGMGGVGGIGGIGGVGGICGMGEMVGMGGVGKIGGIAIIGCTAKNAWVVQLTAAGHGVRGRSATGTIARDAVRGAVVASAATATVARRPRAPLRCAAAPAAARAAAAPATAARRAAREALKVCHFERRPQRHRLQLHARGDRLENLGQRPCAPERTRRVPRRPRQQQRAAPR